MVIKALCNSPQIPQLGRTDARHASPLNPPNYLRISVAWANLSCKWWRPGSGCWHWSRGQSRSGNGKQEREEWRKASVRVSVTACASGSKGSPPDCWESRSVGHRHRRPDRVAASSSHCFCCDKPHWREQLKGDRPMWLTFQVTAQYCSHSEQELAVKSKNDGVHFCPFLSSGPWLEMVMPALRVALPISINPVKKTRSQACPHANLTKAIPHQEGFPGDPYIVPSSCEKWPPQTPLLNGEG